MEKENIFMERLLPLFKKQRLIDFYKSQKFADCTFRINQTEIKAHKLILACSSPVFEKMFYGDLASNEILVTDVNLEEFNQALEFIYTERIYISSVVNAWSLFYVADKYLLDDLTRVCLGYITNNLTMSSLVLSYEYAEMYNLTDVKQKCFSDMVNYASGALSGDYHMKASTLKAVLNEINFQINKIETVIRVINWAAVECEFLKIQPTSKSVVNVLKNRGVLRYFNKSRVLSSSCDECCVSITKCQCVDDLVHETLLLVKRQETSKVSNFPLSEKEESVVCDRFKPSPNVCRLRKEFKIACRVDLRNDEEYVSSVSVDRKLLLFGVLISTEMNPTRFADGFYEGSIKVRVCKQNSKVSVAKPSSVRGVIDYNSDCYLPMKELIVLEPNVLYDIRVSYENRSSSDVAAVHCYYMSNKLVNENKDCVVSFYEMFGALVKGLSFYAA